MYSTRAFWKNRPVYRKRRNVVNAVTSDTSGLYDYPFIVSINREEEIVWNLVELDPDTVPLTPLLG